MKFQLHSIEHAPSSLPYWPQLLDQLCNPPPDQVAKVLGLSERTIRRYNATGYAPRVVCLAVFWLTSWGRSTVHAQAHNDAILAVGYVRGLCDQIEALRADLAHLEKIGHFGAANEPHRLPPGAHRPIPKRG